MVLQHLFHGHFKKKIIPWGKKWRMGETAKGRIGEILRTKEPTQKELEILRREIDPKGQVIGKAN